MAIAAVDPHYRVLAESTNKTNDRSTMGKDQFLQLLVTQLTYQDPLNPISNENFSAQMAQFSSLEQTMESNKNMKAMYTEQSIAQAAALLGKQVYAVDADTNESTIGVVNGIKIEDGVPMLKLDSGESLSLYDVQQIIPVEA
jgi:flagellar basal-body rod modification protein FlgD